MTEGGGDADRAVDAVLPGSGGGDGNTKDDGSLKGGASAPERWEVESLNVGVATGILLHQLLASARATGQ